VSLALQQPAGLPDSDTRISGAVARLLDRLKTAIAERGYDAVMEDLSSPELVGGDDSLLGSDQVMVIPGYLDDAARPILLAVTKGWGGKEPQTFAKVMRQVKARLIEARGAIQVVGRLLQLLGLGFVRRGTPRRAQCIRKERSRFPFLVNRGSQHGCHASSRRVCTDGAVRLSPIPAKRPISYATRPLGAFRWG
jgi:hypothetical protein